MIVATGIELRAGARLLLEDASFRIDAGDRIGLVGRNGAGKTTLTKVLAGEGQPAAGTVTRTGPVGYLPQDPRTGDLDTLARDRILSARGLDVIVRQRAEAEARMASDDAKVRELQDHVKGRLAPYKYPRAVRFVEAMPRNTSGKLQHFKLREMTRSTSSEETS